MALGGFLCPFCNYYNANDATVCSRCEKRLPPPGLAGPLRSILSIELWATKMLAGISIVVFALQIASAGGKINIGLAGMPFPTLLRFGAMSNLLNAEEPYRLLAACFVHMGVLHVAMNMLALANLGRLIEPEIKGARLIIAYVVTGLAGFAASLWWYGDKPYITAGASGAILGLEGLIIGSYVAKRDRRWKDMVTQMLVSSVLLALAFPVNNSAHAGGFLAGLALGAFMEKESRPWKIAPLVNGAAVACVVAIAVSLVLPQRSATWRVAAQAEEAREQRRQQLRTEEVIEP